jgi:hypothetical protein
MNKACCARASGCLAVIASVAKQTACPKQLAFWNNYKALGGGSVDCFATLAMTAPAFAPTTFCCRLPNIAIYEIAFLPEHCRLQNFYEGAIGRLEFELTADVPTETARIVAEDLEGWRSLYASRILTPPA